MHRMRCHPLRPGCEAWRRTAQWMNVYANAHGEAARHAVDDAARHGGNGEFEISVYMNAHPLAFLLNDLY